MAEYSDRVAVITGAASGIGYGLAKKCISSEMHVVLADIDSFALEKEESEFRKSVSQCIRIPTDVTKLSDVKALAHRTYDLFGEIQFLFINAGVNILAHIWEYDIYDWKWIIDVNLWGTIHCLNVFLPLMKNQENDSFIVITSSGGAFLPYQTAGPYNATKSAILALAETLYNELQIEKSKIRVHVLCPGMVNTSIDKAEVHRQGEYKNPNVDYESEKRMKYRIPHRAVEAGISIEEVADAVFSSIEKNEFYVFPQPEIKQMIARKYELILQRNMPLDLSQAMRRDSP
jgi:NADP-dependent 3-hydroxy acid dehydrogenase YdfG